MRSFPSAYKQRGGEMSEVVSALFDCLNGLPSSTEGWVGYCKTTTAPTIEEQHTELQVRGKTEAGPCVSRCRNTVFSIHFDFGMMSVQKRNGLIRLWSKGRPTFCTFFLRCHLSVCQFVMRHDWSVLFANLNLSPSNQQLTARRQEMSQLQNFVLNEGAAYGTPSDVIMLNFQLELRGGS